jgi:hypothetical protein
VRYLRPNKIGKRQQKDILNQFSNNQLAFGKAKGNKYKSMDVVWKDNKVHFRVMVLGGSLVSLREYFYDPNNAIKRYNEL